MRALSRIEEDPPDPRQVRVRKQGSRRRGYGVFKQRCVNAYLRLAWLSLTFKAALVGCPTGGNKVPVSAAFPGGLPEELLGASVASQPFSEGSDSEHSSKSESTAVDAF